MQELVVNDQELIDISYAASVDIAMIATSRKVHPLVWVRLEVHAPYGEWRGLKKIYQHKNNKAVRLAVCAELALLQSNALKGLSSHA